VTRRLGNRCPHCGGPMDTISSPADYLIRECPREDCRAVVYIPTRRLDDRCGWCQNCDWSRYRVEADHCRLDRSCSEANNWAEFVPFRRRRARGNHLSYQLAEQMPRTEVWHVISSPLRRSARSDPLAWPLAAVCVLPGRRGHIGALDVSRMSRHGSITGWLSGGGREDDRRLHPPDPAV